jgi:hypothetical protein
MNREQEIDRLIKIASEIINQHKDSVGSDEDLIVIVANKTGYSLSSLNRDRESRDIMLASIVEHRMAGGDYRFSGDVLQGGKPDYYKDRKE